MDKSYLNELLQRYLTGAASREERKAIITYYNLFQKDSGFIDSLTPAERAGIREMIRNATWEKIELAERRTKTRRLFSTRNLGLVAAVALLVFFLARAVSIPAPAKPAKSSPVFVRSKGESHVIVLPDGSSVILDSGSKLNYPSSFDGLSKREVFLTGQAFFDVRHLASTPFIVHAGMLKVTVLGTAFNVRALREEGEITVTVKRGKVKVSEQTKTLGVIVPRQQIIYDRSRSSFVRKTLTDENSFHWKDGDLAVDNLTVPEAARVLEERFHVKISVVDPFSRSERFTAIFPRGENLDQALKGICIFNGATYRYVDTGSVQIRLP